MTSTILSITDAQQRAGVRTLIAARALRDFGDGFVAVLLPVYLAALGLDAFHIGVVATTALLGSATTTLAIGWLGARFDQRRMLIAASVLMMASGVAFATASALAVVLVIAFVGTVNPSAGNTSIFVPLEHALLTRQVTPAERTAAFAHYGLVGALAAACGAFAAASPDHAAVVGLDRLGALKAMFGLYAVLGVVGAVLYSRIPADPAPRPPRGAAALGPSRAMVYKLAALFSIDSFAGGFAVQSLLALYLFDKFALSLTTAGLFFFWAGVAGAFSLPVAAWLARRIGLVNTMVFTHMPSSVFLIVAALAPNVELALVMLWLRSALSSMDQPTRSSYVMAVVTPAERPAAASVTAVPRSLASAISPAVAGALYAAGFSALPLILCGTLKIIYDLALLWTFRHVTPPEES